ncbi:MAG: hypothetical protein GOV15_04320 [Candidatus Diapherotrites archaeon]|nr:hypothetical protein [Candidatus Diapherotrites archaeon]
MTDDRSHEASIEFGEASTKFRKLLDSEQAGGRGKAFAAFHTHLFDAAKSKPEIGNQIISRVKKTGLINDREKNDMIASLNTIKGVGFAKVGGGPMMGPPTKSDEVKVDVFFWGDLNNEYTKEHELQEMVPTLKKLHEGKKINTLVLNKKGKSRLNSLLNLREHERY